MVVRGKLRSPLTDKDVCVRTWSFGRRRGIGHGQPWNDLPFKEKAQPRRFTSFTSNPFTSRSHVGGSTWQTRRSSRPSEGHCPGAKTETVVYRSPSPTCTSSTHHRDLLRRRRGAPTATEEGSHETRASSLYPRTGLQSTVIPERPRD